MPTATPTPVQLRPPTALSAAEVEVLNERFETAHPTEAIRWATTTFGDGLCLTTSFSDTLLIDLAVAVDPDIEVVFLDTGFHFAETLDTLRRAMVRYELRLRVERPDEDAPDLWESGTEACCAARKVQGLVAAGARETVVAPEAVSELAEASENGAIRWQQRTYRRGEVASYRLAVAATGDPDVNGQVHWDAEAAGVWLNAADDPDRCSFTLPAVVRRGDLQIAVSTNGRSPAVAAWLRRSLEESIGPEHATLLALAAEVREDLRAERGTTETPDWQFALDEDLLDLIRSDDVDGARLRLRRALGLPGVPDFEEAAS